MPCPEIPLDQVSEALRQALARETPVAGVVAVVGVGRDGELYAASSRVDGGVLLCRGRDLDMREDHWGDDPKEWLLQEPEGIRWPGSS